MMRNNLDRGQVSMPLYAYDEIINEASKYKALLRGDAIIKIHAPYEWLTMMTLKKDEAYNKIIESLNGRIKSLESQLEIKSVEENKGWFKK